jgi:hypothetical protein
MNTNIQKTTNNALQIVEPNQDAEMIKNAVFDEDTKKVMLRAVAIRFQDLEESQKVEFIGNELEQSYLRVGVSKDEKETKGFTVAELIGLFNTRKQITHREITHIFRQGSLGIYGKYFGINVKSVNDWIIAFYEDEQRKLAIRKLNDLKKASEAVKEFTPAEKESIMVKMVKEIYYERTQNGFDGTEMLSYPVYNILKTKGILNLNERQKAQLLEEAESMVNGGYYDKDLLMTSTKNLNEAEKESCITNLAKVLAVRDYLNDLEKRNMDLPL